MYSSSYFRYYNIHTLHIPRIATFLRTCILPCEKLLEKVEVEMEVERMREEKSFPQIDNLFRFTLLVFPSHGLPTCQIVTCLLCMMFMCMYCFYVLSHVSVSHRSMFYFLLFYKETRDQRMENKELKREDIS